MGNLIPNADFSSGLSEWECTPGGVSVVAAAGKRFVMLAGETSAAAICSDPIEVVPNAAYRLWAEKAIRGDLQLAMIGRGTLDSPDGADEVVPTATPVRIQATGLPGKRVGISKVVMEPVGPRLRLDSVRSTALFAPPGSPFDILCEVRNTGSEPISLAEVVLESVDHEMLEEYRHPVPVPSLDVGASALLRWQVLRQRRAVAKFSLKLLLGKQIGETSGFTLKHQPRNLDKPVHENVAGTKRWFSVGGRTTRVVAHETDLGFGPMLVTAPLEKASLGVLHQCAQIVMGDGVAVPMFSELKRVTSRGVELVGALDIGRWTITVSPDLSNKGVLIEVGLTPRRRLDHAMLEFGPFQTQATMIAVGDGAMVLASKTPSELTWLPGPRTNIVSTASPDAGILIARTPAQKMLPGVLYRAAATIGRPSKAIIRTK